MDNNVMEILRAMQTQMREQETHMRNMEQRLIRQEREDSPIRIPPRDSDRSPAAISNNRENRRDDRPFYPDDEAAYAEEFRATPSRRQPEIASRDRNSNVTNRRSTNSFYARDRDTNEHDPINPSANFHNQNIHGTTSPNRTESNSLEERFPFTRNTTRNMPVNIIQSVVAVDV
jgi:hypothetical protein